jgi:hypothetical protein
MNTIPTNPTNESLQSVPQTTPFNAPTPSHSPKLLITLLIVMLLIAIGFAGWFYYQTTQLTPQTQTLPIAENNIPQVNTKPITKTGLDMSSWKKASTLYTFMYPPKAELIQKSALYLTYHGQEQLEEAGLNDGWMITFNPLEKLGTNTLEDIVAQRINDSNYLGFTVIEEPMPVTINGNSGLSYRAQNDGEHIFLSHPTKADSFVELTVVIMGDDYPTYKETTDAVIGSFAFASNNQE